MLCFFVLLLSFVFCVDMDSRVSSFSLSFIKLFSSNSSLTPFDVKITTVSTGTSEDTPILNWQVRIAEGYTAPIVSSVELYHHPFRPTNIVVDHRHTFLYWSDTSERTIRRSKVDGTFIELVASGESVGRVLGMALTEDGNTLYYTDANTGTMLRLNVSGVLSDEITGKYEELALTYSREIVLSGLSDPRGLVLDESHGTVYFVELTGRIYECNMDGSNMEPNVARSPKYRILLVRRPSRVRLNSISLDVTSSLRRRGHSLYWVELNSNTIMKSNVDGRKIKQVGGLNSNLVWPNVIQYVRGGDVYFSEYLGTIKKITPPINYISQEPASVTQVDVKGTASDMVSQEILALSRVGAEFRFSVNE